MNGISTDTAVDLIELTADLEGGFWLMSRDELPTIDPIDDSPILSNSALDEAFRQIKGLEMTAAHYEQIVVGLANNYNDLPITDPMRHTLMNMIEDINNTIGEMNGKIAHQYQCLADHYQALS